MMAIQTRRAISFGRFAWASALERRWREAVTPRARLGLLIFAGLIFLWLYIALGDEAERTRAEIHQMRDVGALSVDPASRVEWARRAETAGRLRETLTERLWSGRTAGIIAARIEEDLRGLPTFRAATSLRLQVQPEPVSLDGQLVLRFDVSARLRSPQDVAALLGAFLGHDKLLLIDQLDVRAGRIGGANMTLRGYAPIAIPAEGGP